MCGIGGIFYQRETNPEILRDTAERICATMPHRGPDDSGIWIDASTGLALAHTRLSIIDLSDHGHQPMISRDGRFVISYNGEIYNHKGLKTELRQANVELAGHSDSEIALEYIARFGLEQALLRFNGMFAIALWDKKGKCLHLIRDRIGIKPLYFGRIRDAWIFGSELKAFSQIPDRPRDINADALGMFIRHGYVPDDSCIFQGMDKVRPGAVVTIPCGTAGPSTEEFWSLRNVIDNRDARESVTNERQATDLLQEKLTRSVHKRMVSDVPLGAFLSGGIDSGTIVSLMQELSDVPVNTFTIGFSEKQFDESRYASVLAESLGTNHTSLIANANDALKLIADLPTIYDEPFADSSQIPTIMVSRLAAEHVKVVLSGDGGDELFGGYMQYAKVAKLWRVLGKIPSGIKSPLGAALRNVSRPDVLQSGVLRLAALLRAQSSAEFYHSAISMLNEVSRLVRGAENLGGRFMESCDVSGLAGLEEEMPYTDFINYLPGDILTKVDRASMSASLEARVPLLDHEVVEAVWSMPLKIRGNTDFPKRLLKNVLFRRVSPALFDRPKSGFSVPLALWLRGPLKGWAEQSMAGQRQLAEDILDFAALGSSWNDFLDGKDNQTNILWNCLNFLSWREAWCAN